MSEKPATLMEDYQEEEIATLVRTLHETQERLQELAGGEVDAVLHPGGQSYLLHEAQEKLRQSEAAQHDLAATQSSILNALPAHIALLDHKGTILSVNDGWRHFAGSNGLQSSAAGVGKNYLEVCDRAHGDSAEEAHEAAAGIRAILAGANTEFALEYPCHSPSEQRWFQLRVSPTENDGLRGAVVMHVVITERKRAEKHIAEQAALIDEAHDAIVVRDLEHRITFWSKGAERLYGWTAEEARGSFLHELLQINATSFAEADRGVRETGVWNGEIRERARDGTALTLDGRWTLVRDAQGQAQSILNIDTDITERKMIENQFLRSQRMESIGTLAGGIAHDLNNILAPIMMSVPMLRRDLTAEQREGIISTVEQSAERGAEIVKQVLTFGRGLEGKKIALQVGALINELLKIMRGTFPKNLAIESSLDPKLWLVSGDATQLHQVLLNLCVNARDAMPDGGTLRLHAANLELDASYASMVPEATPGPHVLLEVSDTGCGIPPEIVERIFDPFFTTKGVGQGTGLGLATVHGIVKSHGGFIRVSTQPGKGTTFHVYLPASPDGKAAPTEATRLPVPKSHGELVLVVDDEAPVSKAARIALETAGYRVLVAGDGTEALAVFAMNSGSIAVVLTDLMMPLMGGVLLIRALRKMAPGLPIIASTGLGEKVQLLQLKAMGVETVLQKPYDADCLLRAIHHALHPEAPPTDDATSSVTRTVSP